MKKSVLALSLLATAALAAPSACTGIDPVGALGACDQITCVDALKNGLSQAGEALCDATANNAYGSLLACGCGASGLCNPECGPNLCIDGIESTTVVAPQTRTCKDCLETNCAVERATCGRN